MKDELARRETAVEATNTTSISRQRIPQTTPEDGHRAAVVLGMQRLQVGEFGADVVGVLVCRWVHVDE
jgi:hypothetical protein